MKPWRKRDFNKRVEKTDLFIRAIRPLFMLAAWWVDRPLVEVWNHAAEAETRRRREATKIKRR